MPNLIENRRILLVDDDQVSSQALAQRLERRGFCVMVESEPDNVLNRIVEDQIEMVLLDIVMPKMDGVTLLKKIREKYGKNELPVMMVTAMDDTMDVVSVFAEGANDYLSKPVSIDVAVARISAHISIVDLYRETTRLKEVEAVRAMIVTCNHEFNNPLMIALGSLTMLEKQNPNIDKELVDRLRGSLNRLTDVVKQVRHVINQKQLNYDDYTENTKMVSLKKRQI